MLTAFGLIIIGRAGSTFGDPEAAAKGDTSAETQFKKGPGDFSADTGGSGVKDIGDTVCALSCAPNASVCQRVLTRHWAGLQAC